MTGTKPFNHMTILPDGSGQITGLVAEVGFASELIQQSISFSWVGSEKGPYDFVCDMKGTEVKIDVKCKKRNVPPTPFYSAHVTEDQRNYDCNIYVFASLTDENLSFMGWYPKPHYWRDATLVKKGDPDGRGYTERADAGKMEYGDLKPMKSLFETYLK